MGSPFIQPNYTTQLGAEYKTNLDNADAVNSKIGAAFHAQAQTVPNMTVRVLAGSIFNPSTNALTNVAAQNSATISAPVSNSRIDRIVVDALTGVVSVITGTPAGSPVAPAITAGKIPVAQVLIAAGQTSIVNADITDERNLIYVAPTAASLGTPTIMKRTVITGTVAGSTVSGNYAIDANMVYADVTLVAPGGSGAGVTSGASQNNGGTGGGGGAGAKKRYTRAQMLAIASGTNVAYSIATAPAGGASSGANGTAAGNATFGSGPSLSCTGGGGGTATGVVASSAVALVGSTATGGTATGGDINVPGQPGGAVIYSGLAQGSTNVGGNGPFGLGSSRANGSANVAGTAGFGYGSGGSSGSATNGGSAAGGAGGAGILIIEEWCTA